MQPRYSASGLTARRIDMSDVTLWTLYQEGVAYHNKMGFSTKFPTFVRFKEGDQWPQATEPHELTHAPDAIRYFCSGRPYAGQPPVTKYKLPPELRQTEEQGGYQEIGRASCRERV